MVQPQSNGLIVTQVPECPWMMDICLTHKSCNYPAIRFQSILKTLDDGLDAEL